MIGVHIFIKFAEKSSVKRGTFDIINNFNYDGRLLIKYFRDMQCVRRIAKFFCFIRETIPEFAPIMAGAPSVQTPTSLLQLDSVYQKIHQHLKYLDDHLLGVVLAEQIL